jgi:hypothetical protein
MHQKRPSLVGLPLSSHLLTVSASFGKGSSSQGSLFPEELIVSVEEIELFCSGAIAFRLHSQVSADYRQKRLTDHEIVDLEAKHNDQTTHAQTPQGIHCQRQPAPQEHEGGVDA